MSNPKISVVVIYGNSEDAVKDFISSFECQKFIDYEAVFVNCNSSENAIEAVSEKVKSHENWNMITLPYNNDYEAAKRAGFEVVSGEYICFVDIKEKIYPDFISNIYYENLKQNINPVKTFNNKLYKRSFLENHSDIDDIINNKIKEEIKKLNEILSKNEDTIKQQIEDCYKNTDLLVNNKIFNVNTRFDSLQNLIFEKEKSFSEIYNKIENSLQEKIDENIKSIINNFQEKINEVNNQIKEYINAEINEQGCEINKIYDEITKNYTYTEKILNDLKEEIYREIYVLKMQTQEFLKEQNIRYNNIERLINTLREETQYKFEALDIMQDKENIDVLKKTSELLNMENNFSKNFDKIYDYINENNNKFYDELSNFYKEIDERIKK